MSAQAREVLSMKRGSQASQSEFGTSVSSLTEQGAAMLDTAAETIEKMANMPEGTINRNVRRMLPDEEAQREMIEQGGMLSRIGVALNSVFTRSLNVMGANTYIRGGLWVAGILVTTNIIQNLQGAYEYLYGEDASQEIEAERLARLKKSVNQTIDFVNNVYDADYNDNAVQSLIDKIDILKKSQRKLNKGGKVNTAIPPEIVNDLMKGYFSAVKHEMIKNKNKKKKKQKSDWGRTKVHIPIKHTAYGEPQLPT